MSNPPGTLVVEPEAVAALLAARAGMDGDDLALSVEVIGVAGNRYTYHVAFLPIAAAGPGDRIEHHGGLAVLIPEDSVDRLIGARVRAAAGGVEIDNPNTPSPPVAAIGANLPDPGLPVGVRVRRVIEDHINPAIASHGGRATLVGVDGDTAYITMMGGCQGCTLAGVTLAEGIEVLVKRAAPEIAVVTDVTDHEAGTTPYFAPA